MFLSARPRSQTTPSPSRSTAQASKSLAASAASTVCMASLSTDDRRRRLTGRRIWRWGTTRNVSTQTSFASSSQWELTVAVFFGRSAIEQIYGASGLDDGPHRVVLTNLEKKWLDVSGESPRSLLLPSLSLLVLFCRQVDYAVFNSSLSVCSPNVGDLGAPR